MGDHFTETQLRRWREAAGMSLTEVADLTGASPAMLSRLERRLRSASPALKIRMARRLGVRVADLFEVEELGEADR